MSLQRAWERRRERFSRCCKGREPKNGRIWPELPSLPKRLSSCWRKCERGLPSFPAGSFLWPLPASERTEKKRKVSLGNLMERWKKSFGAYFSEGSEASVVGEFVSVLDGGRIRPRGVARVGQGQISNAQIVKHSQYREAVADGMTAFDSDEARYPVVLMGLQNVWKSDRSACIKRTPEKEDKRESSPVAEVANFM